MRGVMLCMNVAPAVSQVYFVFVLCLCCVLCKLAPNCADDVKGQVPVERVQLGCGGGLLGARGSCKSLVVKLVLKY